MSVYVFMFVYTRLSTNRDSARDLCMLEAGLISFLQVVTDLPDGVRLSVLCCLVSEFLVM